VPGLAARACGLREALAMPVGALEAAKIGTLAEASAAHEECHVGLLRLRRNVHDRKYRNSRNDNRMLCKIHPGPPFHFVMAERERDRLYCKQQNAKGIPRSACRIGWLRIPIGDH
jgi:hypothetical protein